MLNDLPELDADRALFEGKVQAIVVACYENERPLAGLAGLMDWRFRGAISSHLRTGAITGKVGECVYFPITRKGTTYHLVLVGAGQSTTPGNRVPVPLDSVKKLQKNLSTLKLPKIAVSRTDFGHVSDEFLQKHLKGVELTVVQ